MSEGYKITTDYEADWAVGKIKENNAEYERLAEIAEYKINQIKESLEYEEKRRDVANAFLIGALEDYFSTVKHKVTKTKESYKLLSGSLVLKRGGNEWERDDDVLIEFLKANDSDYVKVVEKVDWADYKKKLSAVGGKAYDNDTGEEIPGITVSKKPDKFEVV